MAPPTDPLNVVLVKEWALVSWLFFLSDISPHKTWKWLGTGRDKTRSGYPGGLLGAKLTSGTTRTWEREAHCGDRGKVPGEMWGFSKCW